jgi:GNAT superfamily N-acetyltransferase
MLAGRFNDDALRDQLHAPDKWLELLRLSGTPVGYCGYELSRDDPDALKLGQLYVLESHRGKGLGRFTLGYVEKRATELGRHTLTLQVNKRNTGAIEFYRAAGFEVVRAAVFDIGAVFVMAMECRRRYVTVVAHHPREERSPRWGCHRVL